EGTQRSDFVNTAFGALIRRSQSDGPRSVFDIHSRVPPRGPLPIEEDGGPSIVHTPEVREHSVEMTVFGAIDYREPEYRSGELRLAHHSSLHQDIVIVVL